MPDIDDIPARLLRQPQRTHRRLQLAAVATGRAMVADLQPDEHLVVVSKGQVSVLDLVMGLMDRLGGLVDIDVASWRTGTDDAAVLGHLVEEGRVRRVRLLIGFGSTSIEPGRLRLYENWVGAGSGGEDICAFVGELFEDAWTHSPTPDGYSYGEVAQGLREMMGGSELVAEVTGYHVAKEAALQRAGSKARRR